MPKANGKPAAKEKKANRYQAILVRIFQGHYKPNENAFDFERSEIEVVARRLKIKLPKNIGDVLYSQRYRAELPQAIQSITPSGHEWVILPAGRGRYRFQLIRGSSRVLPRIDASIIKVPDATPEIIAANAESDEQALLAKVRYNRLIDIFLGITAYSLQNHLRTSVQDMARSRSTKFTSASTAKVSNSSCLCRAKAARISYRSYRRSRTWRVAARSSRV